MRLRRVCALRGPVPKLEGGHYPHWYCAAEEAWVRHLFRCGEPFNLIARETGMSASKLSQLRREALLTLGGTAPTTKEPNQC